MEDRMAVFIDILVTSVTKEKPSSRRFSEGQRCDWEARPRHFFIVSDFARLG